MSSSYFVTYGGNRVTFGGTPGPVAWEYVPSYSETLLWKGDAYKDTISLSGYPSAYEVIRIVPGGGNQGNNSMLYIPLEVSWRTLSSTNTVVLENPMFGGTAASGVTAGWWFGAQLTGCSGQHWTFDVGYGRRWMNTAREMRYDFTRIKEIWGIKYGEL